MRLNEKNVASFAVCSSPVDKEGYLQKKGDLNRDFQRRWFVLKGNLLFYFQKKQDREPQGVIVLEACSVQVSLHGRYSFEISFDGPGTRVYVLGADNDDDMQQWMKAISHASYEYLKSIVDELQRRVNVLSSSSTPQKEAEKMEVMNVGPVAATGGISRSKTTKDTTVTVQELRNPIAPRSKSTKIKKGVLVDVSDDDEAPPVPAKKKSMTIGRVATTTSEPGVSYTDRLLLGDADDFDGVGSSPSPEKSSSGSHLPLSAAQSLPVPHPNPFSSPLVPSAPLGNSAKPLSPPSTLDRTPVLQPVPSSDNLAALTLRESSGSPQQQLSPQHNGAVGKPGGHLVSSEPSSHPPQVGRKVAAPLDPTKSFIEMHEDFTQAMKTLNAERTAEANNSSSPS